MAERQRVSSTEVPGANIVASTPEAPGLCSSTSREHWEEKCGDAFLFCDQRVPVRDAGDACAFSVDALVIVPRNMVQDTD